MPRQLKSSCLLAVCLLALAPLSQGLATTASVVAYDALGGAENGGDSFSSGGPILVDEIKPAAAGSIASVKLYLSKMSATAGQFQVVLTKISGSGKPSLRTVLAIVNDAPLTATFQVITVAPKFPVALAAGATYYIGIMKNGSVGSSVVLGNTIDPKVLSRSTVVAGGYYYNNGGVQANAGGPYQIEVRTTP